MYDLNTRDTTEHRYCDTWLAVAQLAARLGADYRGGAR